MKNISQTPAVLISLALTFTSVPLPAFSAVTVQTQVSQSAVPGAITGLPVNTASPNLGNGSLLTPASRLELGGTLALPPSPIVAVPGGAAAQTVAAPTPVAPMAPVAVAAEGSGAPIVAAVPAAVAPAMSQAAAASAGALKAGLTALPAEASADPVAAPVQGQSLIGRLASALAGKLSFGRVFDNSGAPAPGAVMGILPQKANLPEGMVLDEAPSAPDPKKSAGVFMENYDLPGVLDTGSDIFSGGATVLQADPADAAQVERALRAMIDADPARYGVSSAELATVHVKRIAGLGQQADTIYAYFQQQRNGLVMHGTGQSFTMKVLQGKPVVLASMSKLYPKAAVDTKQSFSDEELKAKALERLGPATQIYGLEASLLEKKIVYVKGAWHSANIYLVQVPQNDHVHAIMVGVDVATGEAFAWNPTTLRSSGGSKDAGASGTLSGKSVEPGPIMPGAEVKEIPLSFLEVTIGGKTYLTDQDGRFKADPSLRIDPAGLKLTATLAGPHARIEDSSGKTLSVNAMVKPGGGDLQIVFNPNSDLNDENALAQVSAFHTVNADYEFLHARKLTTDRMDKNAIIVRTNIDDECNAYYTPGSPSLNFFKSSQNCVNSSYATVSRHEYGHYWDDMTGGIVNGGASEGWGDMLSMYSLNNPIIGDHFLKKPRPDADGNMVDYIRNGENRYQYNENDEVHDQGQAWMGFGWKLRQKFMSELGDAAGAALAESLVLPTMFAKASNIPAIIAQVLLADMDAHGNMPHEADIRATAQIHGITLPQTPSQIASYAKRVTDWVLSLIS